MRYCIVSLVAAVCMPCAVWAQQLMYAIPLQKELDVYQNEVRKLYEKPLFVVAGDSRLVVKETGKNSLRVQDAEGRAGWVEKSLVKIVGENKMYSYDPINIENQLNGPIMLWIIEGDDYVGKPIALDRSFADELRENVDRETIARQTN